MRTSPSALQCVLAFLSGFGCASILAILVNLMLAAPARPSDHEAVQANRTQVYRATEDRRAWYAVRAVILEEDESIARAIRFGLPPRIPIETEEIKALLELMPSEHLHRAPGLFEWRDDDATLNILSEFIRNPESTVRFRAVRTLLTFQGRRYEAARLVMTVVDELPLQSDKIPWFFPPPISDQAWIPVFERLAKRSKAAGLVDRERFFRGLAEEMAGKSSF